MATWRLLRFRRASRLRSSNCLSPLCFTLTQRRRQRRPLPHRFTITAAVRAVAAAASAQYRRPIRLQAFTIFTTISTTRITSRQLQAIRHDLRSVAWSDWLARTDTDKQGNVLPCPTFSRKQDGGKAGMSFDIALLMRAT